MAVIDIHTHLLPQQPGTALVALDCNSSELASGHLFSVGIHPWSAGENVQTRLEEMSRLLSDPSVLAVGECGLDKLKGPSPDIQTDVFLRQVELSERFNKPVILHVVRCFDAVTALRKRLKPRQRWLIHGFRGGEMQARQLLDLGFDLSLGMKANSDTVRAIPSDRLLLETDGLCHLDEVVCKVSMERNVSDDEIRLLAADNASDFLNLSCILH